VARSVHVDRLRRLRRSPRFVSLEDAGGYFPAPEGSEELRGEVMDVREALAGLPDRLRWVVILNIFEGLDYQTVADVLEIPVGTVKSRMHHAILAMKEWFHARA
jgi:RNA polymerase sigma-70 factor (ECF subfamily)